MTCLATLLLCMTLVFWWQILLAVLARRYEWEVDLTEPVKPFPVPVPSNDFHKDMIA